MKKEVKKLNHVKCDVCGYCNNPDFVKYSGVCHGCKKILDEKAYFKAQMSSKLRLWRGKKFRYWGDFH